MTKPVSLWQTAYVSDDMLNYTDQKYAFWIIVEHFEETLWDCLETATILMNYIPINIGQMFE